MLVSSKPSKNCDSYWVDICYLKVLYVICIYSYNSQVEKVFSSKSVCIYVISII